MSGACRFFCVGINVIVATTNGVILGTHLVRGQHGLAVFTVIGILIGWAAIAALMIPSEKER